MTRISKLKDWRLWVHYVVLTAMVVYFFHLNQQHWIHTDKINLIYLFAVISIGDQIIHAVFEKVLGWRD